MDLVERYLQAVRFWLPRAQQDDIINELSEELHAQIAEQQEELGHELSGAELEALLKRSGHPIRVAGRYLPQQQLIGQPWFSLYYFALKALLLVLLPLLAVVSVPVALTSIDPWTRLVESLLDVVSTGIYLVGVATVAVVVMEKLQFRIQFLDDWQPAKLPKLVKVQDTVSIPRSASFGAFVGIMAFALWWMGLLRLPAVPNLHLIKALPQAFYWPVLALLAGEMLLHLVNLFLPFWTRRRAGARLLIDLFALALLALLLAGWPWFGLQSQGFIAATLASTTPNDLDEVIRVVNFSLLVALAFMALSYLLRALQDARRALGKPPFRNFLVSMFAN